MEVDEDWPDPESGWDRGDRYWLNEIIAVDGAPVMSWNDQEYPVVGQADEFQTTIGGFTANTAGERP